MSHPAVEWTLEAIEFNWSAGTFADQPLERVDRDESELMDGDIRKRKSDLKDANYVGVSFADRASDPVGTEFDLETEVVVGVRIEGLHADKWGHVDADAPWPATSSDDAVPWNRLVDEIRHAIYTGRQFPSAGGADVSFTHLLITNEAPQSSNYSDYFRHDFDVAFSGFETLP